MTATRLFAKLQAVEFHLTYVDIQHYILPFSGSTKSKSFDVAIFPGPAYCTEAKPTRTLRSEQINVHSAAIFVFN